MLQLNVWLNLTVSAKRCPVNILPEIYILLHKYVNVLSIET